MFIYSDSDSSSCTGLLGAEVSLGVYQESCLFGSGPPTSYINNGYPNNHNNNSSGISSNLSDLKKSKSKFKSRQRPGNYDTTSNSNGRRNNIVMEKLLKLIDDYNTAQRVASLATGAARGGRRASGIQGFEARASIARASMLARRASMGGPGRAIISLLCPKVY